MLRARQKKNANVSILVCDRGGHRLELDMNGVEKMVSTLLDLCRDPSVAAQYRRRYPNGVDFYMANQKVANVKRAEFVASLHDLLEHAENVPRNVLAQFHHTVGIIHQRLNNAAHAKKAFLQALWIQSSCIDVAPVDLGLTKVALALEVGKSGSYHEAIPTLESAVKDFQKANLDENNEIWTLVSNAMTTFHLAMEKNRILSRMQESRRGQRKSLTAKTGSLPTVVRQRKQPMPRSKTPPLPLAASRRGQL
jgi:tetratricopeptide (TPR) repeat protein